MKQGIQHSVSWSSTLLPFILWFCIKTMSPPSSSLWFCIKMMRLKLLFPNCRGRTTSLSEGHTHKSQQFVCFLVGFSCCCDADIHSPRLTNNISSDLWEDTLVLNANAVVPMPIKAVGVHTLEISCPRKSQVDNSV